MLQARISFHDLQLREHGIIIIAFMDRRESRAAVLPKRFAIPSSS